MKVRKEVRSALRRRLQRMRQEDELEWEFVLHQVLARIKNGDQSLIAERCWVLWWPTRGDIPYRFQDHWAPICEEYTRSMPRSEVNTPTSADITELGRALAPESYSLSKSGLEVLRVELIALARVCAVLREEDDA